LDPPFTPELPLVHNPEPASIIGLLLGGLFVLLAYKWNALKSYLRKSGSPA
jgi:hypothetical protein